MSKRGHTLLAEAAVAFERGADPFATDWLAKHEVTMDECMTMSEQIGLAIRVFHEVLKARPDVGALYLMPALAAQVDAEEARQ